MGNRLQKRPTSLPTYAPATASLPTYANATSTTPTTHHLIRASLFNSRVNIRDPSGIDRYTFAPDSSSEARIWIYAGASTRNAALGYLTFPETHNAFRLIFVPDPSAWQKETHPKLGFTNVKARIGYPHPSSFSFKSSLTGRQYTWTNLNPSKEVVPVQYDLAIEDGHSRRLARLTVDKKAKGGTTVVWFDAVEGELEQALLLLSGVGVITRMSRKGFMRDENLSNSNRWFAFWWYAIMMTAAV
ncbi:hypothetical protein Q7P37_009547 [Cladosporium fusiforme]